MRSILVLAALLMFASCGDEGFLRYEKNQPQAQLQCRCGQGFMPSLDRSICARETSVPTLRPDDPTPILLGDTNGSYESGELYGIKTDGNLNWPFRAFDQNTPLKDATSAVVPAHSFQNGFWVDRITGANRVSIMGTDTNVWYTKTFCVNIPNEKSYVIHVGADNIWKLKLDGKDFSYCDDGYCFNRGLFLEQSFSAGKHFIELKYKDYGSYAAAWFEVFENPLGLMEFVSRDSDLNVVYTTKTLVGESWDYTGEICPEGYVYDICGDRSCKKLEQAECIR